jgi:serine protease Do
MTEHHSKKLIAIVLLLTFFVGSASGIGAFFFMNKFMNQQTGIFDSTKSTETSFEALSAEEGAVIGLVKKANPAVVSIVISQKVVDNNPSAELFENFFGFPYRFEVPAKPKTDEKNEVKPDPQLKRVGGGSGFIISPDGLIVTNKHVIDDENAVYTVILSDGKEFPAKIIGKDPVLDVALIKIDAPEAKNLPVLSLGDSDSLQIGQTVVAIGYALAEFGNTVTKGVVSGIGRHVEAGNRFGDREVLDQAIQTDAAINPGNSGGPLLDLQGKVIGINTAVSQQGQLVGFAIPINTLKRTIESVQKNGRIIRPWLGVRFLPLTPRIAEENKLKYTYGALLKSNGKEDISVVPGSPADKAGLVENDIILEVNGKKLEDNDSLPKEISKFNVGDEITLKIFHKEKEKEVKVKLEEFPVNQTQ